MIKFIALFVIIINSALAQDCALSQVKLFSSDPTSEQNGWVKADGSSMVISTAMNLFAHLGTTFGGDGQYAFNLPKISPITIEGQEFHYYICATGSDLLLDAPVVGQILQLASMNDPEHIKVVKTNFPWILSALDYPSLYAATDDRLRGDYPRLEIPIIDLGTRPHIGKLNTYLATEGSFPGSDAPHACIKGEIVFSYIADHFVGTNLKKIEFPLEMVSSGPEGATLHKDNAPRAFLCTETSNPLD